MPLFWYCQGMTHEKREDLHNYQWRHYQERLTPPEAAKLVTLQTSIEPPEEIDKIIRQKPSRRRKV